MGLFRFQLPGETKDLSSQSGERNAVRESLAPKSDTRPSYRQWDDEETTGVSKTTALIPAAVRRPVRPRLTVMTGISAGQVIPLEAGVSIGRSRRADLVLEDQGVSREHCRIRVRGDGVYVEDLDSTNGTMLNGRLVRAARLDSGDRLQLGPSVVLQLGYFDEAEEDLAKRLYDASTRDPLTRAYNRRYFFQRLEAEVAHAERHRTALGVVLFDLDHFKSINDRHGHAAGDAILRSVVDEMTRSIRADDVLTRYGGEEFAVLVRGYTLDATHRFAERLRARVEATRIRHDGEVIGVTITAGVAELWECAAKTGEGLLALADKRLYRGKLLGRNRVCGE